MSVSVSVEGIHRTSLIDYPGRVAAVVFLGGCNLRCRFCHNAPLFSSSGQHGELSKQLFEYLERRKGLVDGVVVSGGEPLLADNAVDFIRQLKATGLPVKLDTNGAYPEKLQQICEEKLADYVAMDVKTSPEKYAELCGAPVFDRLEKSLDVLRRQGMTYELRTTCVPGYVDEHILAAIGERFGQVDRYYLQQFVPAMAFDSTMHSMEPFHPDRMSMMLDVVRSFSGECALRGV